MTIKTIFLDRDGVINKEVNYLYRIEDFEFINGVFDACNYFQRLGYQVIIITNQSGIGRSYYSLSDYEIITKWMISEFKAKKVDIKDVFYCPHTPESNCDCRKPKPGLFFKAKEKYNIPMHESWMIGDNEGDIIGANAAGIKNTILVRSGHIIDELNTNASFIIDSIGDSNKIIVT